MTTGFSALSKSIRRGRILGVISSVALALMLVVPAAVLASPPKWQITSSQLLPSTVNPGADAGYSFTIKNNGPSNIAQLYLTGSVNASPTYFSSGATPANCSISPVLKCALGALNAGNSISFLVAYKTPTSGSSFVNTFQFNTTGVSFSDGGTSHGDTLDVPFTTTLSANKNFAGRFTLDTTDLSTDASLSKRNLQASAVTPPSTLIPVTIEDGLSTFPGVGTDPCTNLNLNLTCIGDWAKLNVNDGATYPSGIKVVITLYGPSVPSGATVSTIKLWHEGSGLITARCSSAQGPECITVTKIGNNFQIVAYLLHNGGLRVNY